MDTTTVEDTTTVDVTISSDPSTGGLLFRDDTAAVDDPPTKTLKIDISTVKGRIVFRLAADTAGSAVRFANARFPSAPVQFVAPTGGTFLPIKQPDAITVSRNDDAELTIDVVSTATKAQYSFFIILQTPIGRFFGTDPTIVTMPIVPPEKMEG